MTRIMTTNKVARLALPLLLVALTLACALPLAARAAEAGAAPKTDGSGRDSSSPAAPRREAPLSAAVFKFELIDTSGDTTPANLEAQPRRLDLITGILRDELARSGRYRIVAIRPEELPQDESLRARAEGGYFSGCPGCDVEVARALGAQLSITGTVQKVSNLILNINVYVRDTKTDRLLAVHSVDIRGNTDDSWTRGVRYLIKNRLLHDTFVLPAAPTSP
jgi:hypothetical protein